MSVNNSFKSSFLPIQKAYNTVVNNSNSFIFFHGCELVSVSLLSEFTFPSPPPSCSHNLTNLTSKQKVLLITPNHWKLLSCRPPGESSCSAVALIHVAYANVHPFERFSRNMMPFRLPIIVYIITPLHVLVEFWWMTPRSTAEWKTDSMKHFYTWKNFSWFVENLTKMCNQ